MSLAIGGTGSMRKSHGPYWVDVRDFGAIADDRTDNTEAIQAAVDFLAAKIQATVPRAYRTIGTVFIPAAEQSYMMSRPVWVDSPFIEIRGEGPGTRLVAYPQVAHSFFIFGLSRKSTVQVNGETKTLQADGTYRPDLHGILDITAAPASGMRWGFRSHGDSFIQSQVSPLSVGCRSLRGDFTADNWTETTQLTIEFAVEGPNGAVLPSGTPLFGMGVATSNIAYPFVVYMHDSTTFKVNFDTQSELFAEHDPHTFWFSTTNPTGIQRVTIQFDLNNGEISAFVNGTQVAVTSVLGESWSAVKRFAENDYYPMLIGDAGGNRPALGNATGYDFNLYGLLFSRGLRYRDRGPGLPQIRSDDAALPITDAYRYFTQASDDPGLMGYLSFTENPTKQDRLLAVKGGQASGWITSSAYLIHSYQSLPGGITDNAVRNLHMVGGNLYGQNVAVGQVLELGITGVYSSGSYHAIGSLANGANYTVRLEDCVLDATDSGYFGLDQGLWMRNVVFSSAGRATMRFAGCNVNAQNCFVSFWTPNSQSTIKIHSSDYGGNYSFSNVTVDYEGEGYLHSAVYCEAHPYSAATTLRLLDFNLGTIGDACLITLRDGASWFPPAILFVENLQAYTNKFRAALSIEGPKWSGEIKGLGIGDAPRIVSSEKHGPGANVVIHETISGGFPRTKQWCAGAHRIENRNPVDGQFLEWRCVKSGIYGTSSPPVWAGVGSFSINPGAIASYFCNHAYFSAILS